MGIECARARRPALGQDLHREQLGVDFRLEGARRARFAFYAFVRLVRTKSDIPNIALFHCGITRAANKSSTPAAQAHRDRRRAQRQIARLAAEAQLRGGAIERQQRGQGRNRAQRRRCFSWMNILHLR